MARSRRGEDDTVGRSSGRPAVAGQRLAGALGDACRGNTLSAVAHGLRWQVALMHALCAVLTRSAAILVDTLGLALAAADAGTAGAEGRGADDGGHRVSWW